MSKQLLIFIMFILLVLPLGILLFVNHESIIDAITAIRFSKGPSMNQQFSISNKSSDVQTKIVNTAFLDYEFSRLGVFKKDAIVDPRVHRGEKGIVNRYTVTAVEIAVVPTLPNYLVANGGEKDFAAKGSYRVQNNILIIELSLNMKEISDTPNAKEDVLLRTLLETLLYAIKEPNAPLDMKGLFTIQQNLEKYILSGLFDRPIRVIEKNASL